MNLKFSSGDLNELKSLLSKLIPLETDWKEINTNTYQAKYDSISINFYTSTGTIQFQGKPDKTKYYESIIKNLLAGNENIQLSSDLTSKKDDVLQEEMSPSSKFLSQEFNDSEIVIGLVGAVGTQYQTVKEIISTRLKNNFKYDVEEIKISSHIIEKMPSFKKSEGTGSVAFERINNLMNIGNAIRKQHSDNSILALGAVNAINRQREANKFRKAYIIDSLKHPDEVKALREVYGQGFYLIGVFSDINNRSKFLTKELVMTPDEATKLITKDENDIDGGHGQHTSDTFHLSDFFVEVNYNSEKLKESIFRFLDIVFGHPHITPLFEEYSMFMAFTSSLRSADLSRQVGAVLTKDQDIIATGANDIPRFGGGLYWPYFEDNEFKDFPLGRDYTRGEDSNVTERKAIIQDILQKANEQGINEENLHEILKTSRLKDLIEFGRVVHAEMETLMMCARNNISAKHSVLFCTTFPCHNCAKHIVAAGVEKVYYIEPYPKSKALDFHSDSIKTGFKEINDEKFTYFEPFIGVGPRKFFDLFSINFGSGRTIKRKDKEGIVVSWEPSKAKPKVQLFPISYLEREIKSSEKYDNMIKNIDK